MNKDLLNKTKNLFSRHEYFNKVATVKKYIAEIPEEKRIETESFEELYCAAEAYLGKIDYKEYLEDTEEYFHTLSKEEVIIAISLGIVSFGFAAVLDAKGKDIEQIIDKKLPGKYDVNNAFDLQHGKGHRIFGHDIATFGIKNIPADYIVTVKDGVGGNQYIKLGEFLGIEGRDFFSMWDIIWVFYGNKETRIKSVMNCLGHIIAHFGKDIFTPDGLPLPFTSLFNRFVESDQYDGLVLKYKNSFAQKLDTSRVFIKASDFFTVGLIEAVIELYCNTKKSNVADLKGFKHDMKLLSMGTCISIQMATILIGEGIQTRKKESRKLVPGGKINLLMSGIFFKLAVQEMKSVIKARNDVNSYYDEFLEEE